MTFSLDRFIRLASPSALEMLVDKRRLDWPEDFDWSAPPRSLAGAFFAALAVLEPSLRARIERQLHQVDRLACEAGQAALFEACRHDSDLVRDLERQEGERARGLLVLCHDPHKLERALAWFEVDRCRGGQSFDGFAVPPGVKLATGESSLAQFETLARDLFTKKNGIRRGIEVERCVRVVSATDEAPEHEATQLLIYAEGASVSDLVFEEERPTSRTRRPAIPSAIVFDATMGVIEVTAPGGKEIRRQLAQGFVESFAPPDCPIERLALRRYDLQDLKQRRHFPIEPGDPIKSVRLDELALRGRGSTAPTMIFARPPRTTGPFSLSSAIDAQLGRAASPLHDPSVRVLKAILRIDFEPDAGERRPKPILLKITEPHHCNLREITERERLIVQKYLPLWGLVEDVRIRVDAAE